jgi:hypothetical protein
VLLLLKLLLILQKRLLLVQRLTQQLPVLQTATCKKRSATSPATAPFASTSYCFTALPCRLPRQTAINGTVQNNAGEDRVDGLGDLSLHGKQFMRAGV